MSGKWQKTSKNNQGPLWRWTLVGLIVLLLWSLAGFAKDMPQMLRGFPFAADYILGMYPPDWKILPALAIPIIEQFRMSIMSIFLSATVTTVLSFLAARNTTPHVLVYIVVRSFINLCRGLPTMIWALLFVVMTGLGPLAGVMALTTHCIGSLGKYFSETVETIGPQIQEILEAMRVDGANEIQVIYHGLLPAVAPLFLSYILYYFEWTLRVGTTLGLVGAGGLGFRLSTSIRLFEKQQTATIIITILVIVTIVDILSRTIRKRLIT